MAGYDISNRTTTVARDVAVLSCTPAPVGGTAGTPVSFIGIFESFELSLKREFVDTTGAADIATTSRALRWGKGSVKLTGFTRGVANKMAAIFGSCSHHIFQFQEAATGDAYQLLCTAEDFSKSLGKADTNKDTLTFGVESIPFFGAAGAAVSAMTLEG